MYMHAVLSWPLQPSHFSVRTKVGICISPSKLHCGDVLSQITRVNDIKINASDLIIAKKE